MLSRFNAKQLNREVYLTNEQTGTKKKSDKWAISLRACSNAKLVAATKQALSKSKLIELMNQ